jgi:hypothetical protein
MIRIVIMQRVSRDSRKAQIFALLLAQPECYFTHGQIARYVGLKPSPYTRDILLELANTDGGHVHKVEVKAVNGRMAWGYYYSQSARQLVLPCL